MQEVDCSEGKEDTRERLTWYAVVEEEWRRKERLDGVKWDVQ